MTFLEILDTVIIKQERKKFARVRRSLTTLMPIEIRYFDPSKTSQNWSVSLTNDPDEYFQSRKLEGKYQHTFTFPVNSIDEGIGLCKEIYDYHGADIMEIPETFNDLDTNQKIFLAIDITYIVE